MDLGLSWPSTRAARLGWHPSGRIEQGRSEALFFVVRLMFYSGAFFSLGMTTQMLATFPCVSMTWTFQVLQFPQPIHSFQKNIAASWGIKVAVSMREDMPQCPNCCSCSFCDNVFLIPWPSCSMTWSQSWTWSPKIEELSESRRSPNQSTYLQRWAKALTRQPAQLPSFQLQIQPTQPLQQPMQPLPLQMQQPHLQTQPMAMVPVQMQQDIPQATTPGMLLAVPYPMPMDWQKKMSTGMGMLPMVMSTTLGTIISDSSDGFWVLRLNVPQHWLAELRS